MWKYACAWLRCSLQRASLDVSGSMCTSYSTLGSMEQSESQNSILLLIRMEHHFRSGTQILVHENVSGFLSNCLTEEAATRGYGHQQVKRRPSDVNMPVSRYRKFLD